MFTSHDCLSLFVYYSKIILCRTKAVAYMVHLKLKHLLSNLNRRISKILIYLHSKLLFNQEV